MDENNFEDGCVQFFKQIGYKSIVMEDKPVNQIVLKNEFINSISNINQHCSKKEIEQAYKLFIQENKSQLKEENKYKYKQMVTDNIVINTEDNKSKTIKLIDFDNADNNSFVIAQQYNVRYKKSSPIRTPDLVILLNGIPIGLCELKDSDISAESLKQAYNQLTNTYVNDVPNLFYYNQINCVMNPQKSRVGSYTASWNWYLPWRYINNESENNEEEIEYEVMIKGLFNKERILDIIKNYILYDSNNNKVTPAYYQYYGVKNAITPAIRTLGIESSNNPDSRLIGTFSHAQGSGKSISIVDFIKNVENKSSKTPLFVVLTDTNSLDNQLSEDVLENFGVKNTHVDSIRELRKEIKKHTSSGGVITSTIHKFDSIDKQKSANTTIEHIKSVYNYIHSTKIEDSKLDKYRMKIGNIIQLKDNGKYDMAKDMAQDIKIEMLNYYADLINKDISFMSLKNNFETSNYYNINEDVYEHPVLNERSDIIVISDEAHRSQDKNYGRNVRSALPNASQIGFTATPLYNKNKTTMDWFGEEISAYRIDEAQRDNSIIKLDYENRAPKIKVDEKELKKNFRKKEGQLKLNNIEYKKFLKGDKRMKKVAKDINYKFNERQKLYSGNAMLVVNGRKTAYKYEQIFENMDADFEAIAVISDRYEYTDKYKDADLKKKFKSDDNKFELAIVDRKWTVGFNCVKTHTTFLDSPMDSHNIIQTTGRINRIDEGKNSALVVDYVGMLNLIQNAYHKYTSNYDRDSININFNEIISEYKEKCRELDNMISFSDYEDYTCFDSNEKNKVLNNLISQLTIENKEKFILNYDEFDILYSRIHPCLETKETLNERKLFSQLYGRIIAELDREYDNTDKTDVTNKLIKKSIDSEEAKQIELIESNFIENISNPDIDLPRIQNGLLKKMKNDESYDEATYEKFKKELYDTTDKYNSGRMDGMVAAKSMKKKKDKIYNKSKRAKKLGITVKQLDIYDIITEYVDTEIEENKLVNCVQKIDEKIINSTYVDWKERKAVRSDIKYDIMNIIEYDLKLFNAEISKRILNKAEEIY